MATSGMLATARGSSTWGLSPSAAAALAVGAVALTALVSKRYGPTPDHPDVERWYRRLEKPASPRRTRRWVPAGV